MYRPYPYYERPLAGAVTLSHRNSISYKGRHCADKRPSRHWQGLAQPVCPQNRSATRRFFVVNIVQPWNDFDMGYRQKTYCGQVGELPRLRLGNLGKQGILQTLSGESSGLVPCTPKASWGSATLPRYRCFVSLSVQPFLALGGTRPVCLPRRVCGLVRGERSARSS